MEALGYSETFEPGSGAQKKTQSFLTRERVEAVCGFARYSSADDDMSSKSSRGGNNRSAIKQSMPMLPGTTSTTCQARDPAIASLIRRRLEATRSLSGTLSSVALEELLPKCKVWQYNPGDIVIAQGTCGNFVLIVDEGTAAVYQKGGAVSLPRSPQSTSRSQWASSRPMSPLERGGSNDSNRSPLERGGSNDSNRSVGSPWHQNQLTPPTKWVALRGDYTEDSGRSVSTWDDSSNSLPGREDSTPSPGRRKYYSSPLGSPREGTPRREGKAWHTASSEINSPTPLRRRLSRENQDRLDVEGNSLQQAQSWGIVQSNESDREGGGSGQGGRLKSRMASLVAVMFNAKLGKKSKEEGVTEDLTLLVDEVNRSMHNNYGVFLRNIAPGEIVGEIALLSSCARTTTVVAVTPITTVCMPKDVFLELCHDSSAFAHSMMSVQNDRTDRSYGGRSRFSSMPQPSGSALGPNPGLPNPEQGKWYEWYVAGMSWNSLVIGAAAGATLAVVVMRSGQR